MSPDQPDPPILAIDVERSGRGDIVTVRLRGEIDYATAPQLRAAITELLGEAPVPNRIVVDLAGVSMLDSTGLGTLVVGYRICEQAGVRLSVRQPTPYVARLLALTGVDRTLIH